jgi:hypothetical protein
VPEPNPITGAAAERAAGSPLDGAGMAKDAADLAAKVANGDWTEGLVSLGSLAYETKEFLRDPLAKLASMGLGWVSSSSGRRGGCSTSSPATRSSST